jgi:hypothetical protein
VLTSRFEIGPPCPGGFQPTTGHHCSSTGGWKSGWETLHLTAWDGDTKQTPKTYSQGLCSRFGQNVDTALSGHTGVFTPRGKSTQAGMLTGTQSCAQTHICRCILCFTHSHTQTHAHARKRASTQRVHSRGCEGETPRTHRRRWGGGFLTPLSTGLGCPEPPFQKNEHVGVRVGPLEDPACAKHGDHNRRAVCTHVWTWVCRQG